MPLVYDAVSSPVAGDFTAGAGAACIEEDGDLHAVDPGPLAAGQIRFYLALAQNDCGRGPAGTGPGGFPRDVQVCMP